MTKVQALTYLFDWPEWSRPSDDWVRRELVKIGQAAPTDGVSAKFRYANVCDLRENEFQPYALLRVVADQAGVTVNLFKAEFTCGNGTVAKRYATLAHSDAYRLNASLRKSFRLDIENRDAREALRAWDG